MTTIGYNMSYYASRDKAKAAASKLGGNFEDNGVDAGEQRWAVAVPINSSSTTKKSAVASTSKAAGRSGKSVTIDGQTFQSKADAAKFVIREAVSNNLDAGEIHKQLMERVGLTKAGARTYQYNFKKDIVREIGEKHVANS